MVERVAMVLAKCWSDDSVDKRLTNKRLLE